MSRRAWIVGLAALASCGRAPPRHTAQHVHPAAPAGLDAGLDAGIESAPGTAKRDEPEAPSRTAVVQLALGEDASCARHADGLMSCWGRDFGSIPARVRGATDVTEISVSRYGPCARARSGDITCWVAEPLGRAAKNVAVPDAVQLAGDCVRTAAGNVHCFERAPDDPLQLTPKRVEGIDDAVHVAENGGYACAVHKSGGVSCWATSFNGAGNLGLNRATPLGAVKNAIAVAIGDGELYACALRADKTVTCWEKVFHGSPRSMEPGHYTDAPPKPIAGLRDVVELVGGGAGVCARTEHGSVRCWTRVYRDTLSGPLTRTTDVERVAIGGGHACMLRKSSEVLCWGNNSAGQLGRGRSTKRSRPRLVDGIDDAVEVLAVDRATCARRATGAVACWGRLDDALPASTTPRDVPDVSDAAELSGSSDVCVRDRAGRVHCSITSNPHEVMRIAPADAIAASGTFACAITNGSVWCWGSNESGQFGNGATLKGKLDPTPSARGIDDAVAVSVGVSHAAVLRRSGHVVTFGEELSGSKLALAPQPVPGLSDVTQVSSGWGFSCALRATGRVACWGANQDGQLGNATTTRTGISPTNVVGITDATKIASRRAHSCALRAGGDVVCWGKSTWDEDEGAPLRTPRTVPGIRDAVDVSTSGEHACVVSKDGHVLCWGAIAEGKLGAMVAEESGVPHRVLGPER